MVFADLENAFDCILKEVIRWALRRKGEAERELKAIKEMYLNIKTPVKVESMRIVCRQDWSTSKIGTKSSSVCGKWMR